MSLNFRVIGTGDSTTYASSPRSWFFTAMAAPPAGSNFYYEFAGPRIASKWYPGSQVIAHNWAYGGYKLSSLDTQAAELDAMVNSSPPTGGGRPTIYNIEACRIGTNKDETDAAVYAALVRTHYLARQAAGWLVIDLPMWSKTGAGQDAFAQAYNAIKATWGTSDGVAAVVPATEPLLYGTGAYADTTYFNADGIHLTDAGQRLGARDFLVTLDALLVSKGAMAVPTGLVATPAIGDVQLVWDTVSGATWRVYRSTADNFQGATLVATVTAASHAQAGTSGTPYYFWITRYNSTTGEETLPTLSVTATPA